VTALVEETPVTVGVVDIGTNSMRMLITNGLVEVGRWEEVTGLGRGVDGSGALSEAAIAETITVLRRYGRLLDLNEVGRRRAIATSASRDASNREHFFDLAEEALGVRPALIDGEEEARLAFVGATHGYRGRLPVLVSDIGGGSTEFVTVDTALSVDIGSIRLTERAIPSRPAPPGELESARDLVAGLFGALALPRAKALVGVAGTWVELPALARGLPPKTDTHGMAVSRDQLVEVIDHLAGLTVDQTARIPSLHPRRAPVILAGALIAEGVMEAVGLDEAVASFHDTLDGVAMGLLAQGSAG
jgi:exopolyphosphatase / guanosine-5'-triphosphate,3'-diphosphate pyrophosphatase